MDATVPITVPDVFWITEPTTSSVVNKVPPPVTVVEAVDEVIVPV